MNIPLFRLSMAPLPGEVIPLHIFEQRYRDMLSYCLGDDDDTTHPFGISFANESTSSDIGTLMNIEAVVDTSEDGRSVILTSASQRFKIIQSFDTGRFPRAEIELIHDSDIPVSERLKNDCAEALVHFLRQQKGDIEFDFESVPMTAYAFASLANFDVAERLSLLGMTSELSRLRTTKGLLNFRLEAEKLGSSVLLDAGAAH